MFAPDYHNIVQAASNRTPARVPLYDHIVSDAVMEKILGVKFAQYLDGPEKDLDRYFAHYCGFFRQMGYDTVSFERSVGRILPNGGALRHHSPPAITDRKSFENYPWDQVEELYFDAFGPLFAALGRNMPAGMKAVGGIGYGVFECTQELTGYEGLCYIRYDDEELYQAIFQKVGDMLAALWKRFLREYGDIYCVCRFGDDLGFKSSTLIDSQDIRGFILPQYKRIVDMVHAAGKPFLLHSCGNIFDVMEDLIETVGIDAKHSNEEQIAPFPEWVERYGGRIGNFGGVDTDILCQKSPEYIRQFTLDVIRSCEGHGGFAIGSGNSIPDYVPAQGYLAMNRAVREYRGDLDETTQNG